jgi:hypothetical protein
MEKNGMIARIRTAAQKLSGKNMPKRLFTRADIRRRIGYRPEDATKFEHAWQHLRYRDELRRVDLSLTGPSAYAYCEVRRKADARDRVGRAMSVRRSFSCADISKLSGAEISHVQRLARKLTADGWLR